MKDNFIAWIATITIFVGGISIGMVSTHHLYENKLREYKLNIEEERKAYLQSCKITIIQEDDWINRKEKR